MIMPANRMTTARAVIESLRRLNIRTVFGIPGVHNLPLYDGLYHAPEIRHILARNESGAAFMADGYARASGEVAALFTITGPGLLNAMTGLAEAWTASSPILFVATEIPSHTRASGKKGFLHELDDQMALARAVTKWQCRVMDPASAPLALLEAWHQLHQGRRGPVYLEIPLDVLEREDEIKFPDFSTEAASKSDGSVDQNAVRKAAELLKKAERPLLIVGGGCAWADAASDVRRLAERLRSPVLSTPGGKGVFPEDHPGPWRSATCAWPSGHDSAPSQPTNGASSYRRN
jgi:acetolactate synthase-1/2/3 large subunit